MVGTPGDSKAPRLGRRSLSMMIDWLDSNKTDAKIGQLMFKHGLNVRYIGPNKLTRLGNVFHPLISENADEAEMESAKELLEEIVAEFSHADEWGGVNAQRHESYESFQQALRVEGLDVVEGRVVLFLSPSVEPHKEQGVLETRLERWGFSVAASHLDDAVDAASRGKWTAANGQVRSFLEGLCEAIAVAIHNGPGKVPVRGAARKFLAEQGFLNEEESALLKSLFNVLHGEGSHSGTSTSDDCHRRRLMAVSMANYYLERLENWVSNTASQA